MMRFIKDPFNRRVMALTLAYWAFSAYFDGFGVFYQFTQTHENYHIDQIATILALIALTLPVYVIRSNRALVRAVAQRSAAEEEASQIAQRDPLTGLHNRRFMSLLIDRHSDLSWGQTRGIDVSVLLLDLDRFKPINDLRGHHAGDMLLQVVAERLIDLCQDGQEVVRLGGDEFAILMEGGGAMKGAGSLARSVISAMEMPFEFPGWRARISCSIGIANWREGMDGDDLLRHADQAMYKAKALGRGGFVHYDDGLGAKLREQAQIESDLRQAVVDAAIVPHFQPIFDIKSGQIAAFEVLARWPGHEGGPIGPDIFIPIAEDLGLMDRLSDMLLDGAVRALLTWDTDAVLSFNLSPSQFANTELPRRIGHILARHGLPARRLEIEITERAVMRDMDQARAVIGEMVAMGIRIALDDFGTGTSSLSSLMQLPINRIKIDRSFITDVDKAGQNAKIVAGVLALAHSLSLEVTAEGIEHEAELEFLKAQNCGMGQGFLLCRPVSGDLVQHMLEMRIRQAG